jgi:hypothetical protein
VQVAAVALTEGLALQAEETAQMRDRASLPHLGSLQLLIAALVAAVRETLEITKVVMVVLELLLFVT